MNNRIATSDAQIPCRPEVYDPPTEQQAHALALFHMSQADDSAHWPVEKLAFLPWKLCRNEHHAGFATAMVREDTDEVVSLATVTPKRFWAGDREISWAQIGDTFTQPAFQRRGMFSKLVNATRERAQKAGFEVIYGWPNEQSLPGYISKLDFAIHEQLRLYVYDLPLSVRAFPFSTQVRLIQRSKAILQGSVLTAFTRLFTSAAARILIDRQKTRTVEILEGPLDASFDILWARVRQEIGFAQVRDTRYLQSRFRDNPFRFRLLVVRSGVEVRGYLAQLTVASPQEKITRSFLVDWLFAPAENQTTGYALLGRALECAIADHADRVTVLQSEGTRVPLPLHSLGFLRRRNTVPVIFHKNSATRALLAGGLPWHMTLADGDTY